MQIQEAITFARAECHKAGLRFHVSKGVRDVWIVATHGEALNEGFCYSPSMGAAEVGDDFVEWLSDVIAKASDTVGVA